MYLRILFVVVLLIPLYLVSVHTRAYFSEKNAQKYSAVTLKAISSPWSVSAFKSVCSKLRCNDDDEDYENYINLLESAMGNFVSMVGKPDCNYKSGKIGRGELVSAVWAECSLDARYQHGLFRVRMRLIDEVGENEKPFLFGTSLKFLHFEKIELLFNESESS
jgi:hypothetical protein